MCYCAYPRPIWEIVEKSILLSSTQKGDVAALLEKTWSAKFEKTSSTQRFEYTFRPPNYAALHTLESFRELGLNGKLELWQCWPGNAEGLQAQHWKQASNPFTKRSAGVEGYEAIDCPHSTKAWGGLEAGNSNALLNGSVGEKWYYAIGSYQEHSGGIPGPSSAVKCVELHARKPISGEWVLVMRQTVDGSWWQRGQWRLE